jgi:hypothetical protein
VDIEGVKEFYRISFGGKIFKVERRRGKFVRKKKKDERKRENGK